MTDSTKNLSHQKQGKYQSKNIVISNNTSKKKKKGVDMFLPHSNNTASEH